jgi:hypothetical protein
VDQNGVTHGYSTSPWGRRGARKRRPALGIDPWAELLKRCFSIDVLTCTACGARMRLVALVTEPAATSSAVSETTDAPARRPLGARLTGRAAS